VIDGPTPSVSDMLVNSPQEHVPPQKSKPEVHRQLGHTSTTAVEQRYYTLQQTATYTGFSCKTLYRWAEDGIIPATKIGRVWRFDKLKLDSFMQTSPSTEI
jgi:excisionase family DNA binding protein